MKALPHTQLVILLILINIAAFIAVDDIWRVGLAGQTFLQNRINYHEEIVTGTALSPYRYRVLVPYTMEFLIQRFTPFVPYETAFLLCYGLFFFIVIAFVLLALFIYSTLWLSDTTALIGCLYAGVTLAVGFRYFYPYSFLEVGLFTTALYLIYRQKFTSLFLVVVVASFTRETSVFIVVAYAILNRGWRGTVILALTWLVIFVGSRLWLGEASSPETIIEIWQENTSPRGLYETILNWSLFFGPLWILSVRNWKRVPNFLRRTSYVSLLYLIVIMIFGRWEETRLLMVLYPIVLPIALFNFNSKPSVEVSSTTKD
jgi:hypothetical protein